MIRSRGFDFDPGQQFENLCGDIMNALSSLSTNFTKQVSVGYTPSPINACPIVRQVQLAVTRSPHLRQRNVVVFADRGCVTLEGVVASYFEKQMAQEALRNIEGINQIDNQLEVSWEDLIAEEWS